MEAIQAIQQYVVTLDPESPGSTVLYMIPVIGTVYYHVMRCSRIKEFNDYSTEKCIQDLIVTKLSKLITRGRTYGIAQLICGVATIALAGLTPLGIAGSGVCLISYVFLWYPRYLPQKVLELALAIPGDPNSRNETYEKHATAF
ncbi:MAG: hypothetical protein K940chlam3_01046 [Chlamydiae bacterium]|nr:hypothetical protein [Chlamydiota bacterium]